MYVLIVGKNGTNQIIKNVTGFSGGKNVLTVTFYDSQGSHDYPREMNEIQGFIFGHDESERKNLSMAVSGDSV
jgi:hypothetical protein